MGAGARRTPWRSIPSDEEIHVGNMARRTLLAGFVGAVLSGCATAPPPPPEVAAPPPAPAVPAEVAPPQPGPAYVWVPGHWDWRRRGYVWVPGYWALPGAPAQVWVPGHWAPRGAGYVWVHGRWRHR
jgi:hypothetical protein